MKLIVKGVEGKRVFDWGSYALVRDNVQHFIENGQPNGRFPEIHGIEGAVDAGTYVADAARLRGEVLRAMTVLNTVPLNAAAQTSRTRAIMVGSHHRPGASPSVNAHAMGWDLPVSSASADASVHVAAADFIEAVLSVTSAAVDGDLLQVRRAGAAPAFARTDDTQE
jgi:hypothetical protein